MAPQRGLVRALGDYSNTSIFHLRISSPPHNSSLSEIIFQLVGVQQYMSGKKIYLQLLPIRVIDLFKDAP